LGWTAASLLLLLVTGAVGARWWVGRYLHSEAFRQLINHKTSAALQAEGEYLPLHWTGNTAYTDGFYAHGLPASPLRDLRLDQIRADLDVYGLLHRTWRVGTLEIQRLQANLQTPPIPVVQPDNTTPASRRDFRFEFGPVQINDANFTWPMSDHGTGTVRRAQLTIETGPGIVDARGSGGELLLPQWPVMKLGQFHVRSQGTTITVIGAQGMLRDGGTLNASGQLSLAGNTDDPPLTVSFGAVPVTPWLPVDWRARLTGKATGECQIRAGGAVAGKVTLANGRLEALPVLERIALFTGSAQFRSLELQKAEAEFTWQAPRLDVRRARLEAPGLLRMEGACVVTDGIVEGEFDVGVAADTLRWLPGARTRVFTVERDGYQWTKVKVRGPVHELQEDLSGRLVEAAGAELIEGATGVVEQGAKGALDLFRRLLP
jgi:hypothetical protein